MTRRSIKYLLKIVCYFIVGFFVLVPSVFAQQPVSCEEFLKKQPNMASVVVADAHNLSIKVDSNKIVSQDSLALWMSEFSRVLFQEPDCVSKKIRFATNVNDDTYFEGTMTFTDYDLFRQQKISHPEWVRRFEIKEMATTEALKERLQKARKDQDHEKAYKLVSQFLEDDFSNVNARVIKANVLLDQKKYFEAIDIYTDILRQQPDNLIVLFNLSFAKKMIGSFDEAVTYAQAVLKKNPSKNTLGLSRNSVLLHLAEIYLKNNEITEAQQQLEQVSNKKSATYSLLMADVLRRQNKQDAAKKYLVKLIDTGKYTDLVLYNLVALSLDLQDEKGVQEYYDLLKGPYPELAQELHFLTRIKEASQKEAVPETSTEAAEQTESVPEL